MNKILITITTLLLLLTLTGSVTAQEQFAPEVDISSIKTFDDFKAAEEAARERFKERQQEANKRFYDERESALSVWYDRKVEATKSFRAEHFDSYILWLDSREVGYDDSDLWGKAAEDPTIQTFTAASANITNDRTVAEAMLTAKRDETIAAAMITLVKEIRLASDAYTELQQLDMIK